MNSKFLNLLKLILVVFPILFISQFSISFAFDCDKNIYICDWKEKVSIVKTQNITASAVKLTDNFYVTNKHVVEDNYYVNLYDKKGSFLKAKVLQNDHPADLVILSINHENNQAIIPYKIIK